MSLGVIIGALIMGIISGFVIWLVSLFGLGLEVDGFSSAFMAALAIAIVNALSTGSWARWALARGRVSLAWSSTLSSQRW